MVAIVTSRTRRTGSKPPRGRFTLNRDSWQSHGLIAWYPLTTNFEDYVKLSNEAITGALAFGVLPDQGRHWVRTGDARFQRPIKLTNDLVCTFTSWAVKTTGTGVSVILSIGIDAGDSELHNHNLRVNASEQVAMGSRDTGTAQNAAGATTLDITTMRFLAGRVNGSSSRQAFLDGRQDGTNTTARSPTGMDTLFIGADAANANTADSRFRDLRVYDRALSDAELYALYDPRTRWDLYWQPGRKVYFVPAAAGGATTINPTSGTLTLTGNTALVTFKVNRAVTSGTLTLTQTSPGVAQKRNIAPTSGTITLTQTSPTVAVTTAGAVTAGAWTLTGSSATVSFKLNRTVTSGTWTVTGNTASVSVQAPAAPAPSGGDGGAGGVVGYERRREKAKRIQPIGRSPTSSRVFDAPPEMAAIEAIEARLEELEEEGADLMSLPSIDRAQGQLEQLERQIEELAQKRLILLMLLVAVDAF